MSRSSKAGKVGSRGGAASWQRPGRWVLLAALAAGPGGCVGGSHGLGDGTAGAGDAGASDALPTTPAGTGPFMPFAVGNSWTYRVSHPLDGVSMKTTTVEKREAVGGTGPNAGKMALRVVTGKGPSDQTISWQDVVDLPGGAGQVVVRYRETSYQAGTGNVDVENWWVPYKLRFDESAGHTTAGARWSEAYAEWRQPTGRMASMSQQSESWQVLAVDQPVTVPKGTFNCLVITHTQATGTTDKKFWFARNVGKVKEAGGQTEELVEFVLR